MGFHKVIYLYCNGGTECCELKIGEEACSGDTGYFNTIAEYKKAMRAEGWTFKKQKAYCPSCSKIRKRHNG